MTVLADPAGAGVVPVRVRVRMRVRVPVDVPVRSGVARTVVSVVRCVAAVVVGRDGDVPGRVRVVLERQMHPDDQRLDDDAEAHQDREDPLHRVWSSSVPHRCPGRGAPQEVSAPVATMLELQHGGKSAWAGPPRADRGVQPRTGTQPRAQPSTFLTNCNLGARSAVLGALR